MILLGEKGRAEERTKVEAEKHADKIAMAKNMLADGFPIDVISKYSGLSLDEISHLHNK